MDLGLDDKVFLLTAASSGLGHATAEQLVAEGARVVLVGRREELLAERVATLGDDRAAALPGDLSDPALPDRACALAIERFGRLDGALVSVGGPPRGGVLDNSDDEWRTSFESVFLAARRTLAAVVERATDDAAIGFVLSTSSKSPLPTMAISNGLRPGLAMLVKQAADELGPRRIRVFGLLPGSVHTERLDALLSGSDDKEAALRSTAEGIPLRRLGRPDEFGRVATFALSPAASYLTGFVLPVDGGAMRAL
ncbi:SDR family oxidoreductase [Mariniluteicoccus flavus]